MSVAEPPPQQPNDELESLLRTFFRSQMPHPWPSPRVPLAASKPLRCPQWTGRSLVRSRWALAASVALLLLGSLLLPSRFTHEAQPENRLGAPQISSNDLRRKMEQEHKNSSRAPIEEDDHLPEMDDADLPLGK